ncbi:MAG TPA: hypothetical protein DCY53_06845 [Desulfobacteraceae bacterium]|nr:hypothetical protein [Desulfobacteraceae bacterium]
MRKQLSFVLTLLFLMTLSVFGYTDNSIEVIEQKEKGSVNWSRGVVQAKGIGIPLPKIPENSNARTVALTDAKLNAFRIILEIIRELRINGTTVVGDYEIQEPAIMSKIENMVKSAKVVKKEYLTDGTVKIEMEVNLRGGFAQLVLPNDIKPLDSITFVTMDKTSSPVFTGLVVDAKGLGVRPVMVPRILDENNQEVYGSAFVSREYAVQQGMSGYARNLKESLNNQRVADHPLVVKGLKTLGPGRSEIVISNADASKLRSTSESLYFMKKCRVIIVVD